MGAEQHDGKPTDLFWYTSVCGSSVDVRGWCLKMPKQSTVKSKMPIRNLGTLADQAYLAIRERILHGDLTVGTGLSRRSLADELRVSPVPVMKALQQLEHDGLVETRSRVGTRVRVPTAQDISDQFTLREALEVHSARLFSERARKDDRDEVNRMAVNLDDLDAQIEKADDSDHRQQLVLAEHRLHMRLHMRIAACGDCGALTRAIEVNQMLIFKWLLDMIPRQRLPAKWHEQLIHAISANDIETAESAMRIHIRHGLDNVMKTIEHLS
jgi:GntR family transcriptional regulator, rspAB operon transcriptional repressor